LVPGASVVVHAGLEKLGYVVNGALDVIDAIFSLIGRQGTLLVPANSNLTDPEQWQKPPVAKHSDCGRHDEALRTSSHSNFPPGNDRRHAVEASRHAFRSATPASGIHRPCTPAPA
jgi:aminoglycoside N3'-acetyltransferase